MKIEIHETKQLADNAAARLLLKKMKNRKGIIGLATGDTTKSVFELAAKLYRDAPFDLKDVLFSAVDDYYGIEKGHIASCAERIRRQVRDPFGLKDENFLLPESFPAFSAEEAAKRYEAALAKRGGITFQLLGIGPDGHLGFCRPNTRFGSLAHAVELPADTRNMLTAKYGLPGEKLPKYGITLGLNSLMKIPEIVVVATGIQKADAVRRAAKEAPTEEVPASILQEHANVRLILDASAAGML